MTSITRDELEVLVSHGCRHVTIKGQNKLLGPWGRFVDPEKTLENIRIGAGIPRPRPDVVFERNMGRLAGLNGDLVRARDIEDFTPAEKCDCGRKHRKLRVLGGAASYCPMVLGIQTIRLSIMGSPVWSDSKNIMDILKRRSNELSSS